MRVAIIHDWLVGGGAERVVEELHKIYPDAPIYTSYASEEWKKRLDGRVITGYLQYPPFKQLRKFLPALRQRWFRNLDLSDFDLIISSSGNGEAKFVTVNEPAIHICYCHTPTHFYWRHYDQYLTRPGFKPAWLARFGLKTLISVLRKKDYEAAQKVDYFIANSKHIKADIERYYKRESIVIAPPVDTARFKNAGSHERQGFVTAGRQVPLKRTDLIIEACNQLGLPLTVIGRGPEHDRLTGLAGPTITLLDSVGDADMPTYFAGAEAFIFASFEDFGVTPVEALAAGTPVIAFRAGGALDYIDEDKNGIFFDEQTLESLCSALKKFDSKSYSETVIKASSEKFDTAMFKTNFASFIKTIQKKS